MIFLDMNSQLRENTLYHLYNRGNWKAQIFFDEEDYTVFKNIFFYCFKPKDYDLLALCIMPNHYHIIISQKGKQNISIGMYQLGLRYARYFNKKYKTAGHVFQGGFKYKAIQNRNYFGTVIDYVLENPEKANLTEENSYERLYQNEFLINYYYLTFETDNI
jgi:putative transposase